MWKLRRSGTRALQLSTCQSFANGISWHHKEKSLNQTVSGLGVRTKHSMTHHDQDLFENIGQGRVKCLPCSQALLSVTSLKSDSRRQHLSTKKHVDSVASLTCNAGVSYAVPMIPDVPSREPVAANLSLAVRFDISDSEPEDAQDIEANHDLFDQIDVSDDHYFDANGVEIEFSAGTIPAADVSHDQLYQQMDNLHHYDHGILGEEGSPRMEDTGESSGTGDPTIADIVAQMHALGETVPGSVGSPTKLVLIRFYRA